MKLSFSFHEYLGIQNLITYIVSVIEGLNFNYNYKYSKELMGLEISIISVRNVKKKKVKNTFL